MPEPTNKRIVAMGWYGSGNLGDEMLLRQVVHWAAESGASVTAISIDPAYTRRIHGIDAIDYFDYAAIAAALRGSDLLVFGGGGIFQTHNPFTVPGLFAQVWNDISSYARIGLMARQLGVPCLMLGQGVGPLDNPDALEVVRVMFGDALRVSVRDQKSLDWLARAGVDRSVVVAPDPVWAWPSTPARVAAADGSRVLGIAVRPWPAAVGWEEHLIAALRPIVASGGVRLLWLPCQSNEVPGRAVSDAPFIRALAARFETMCEQEIVVADDPVDWMNALARCDALVAMRLHAQVLALRAGTPVLCIEYDEKMASTSMLCGLPTSCRLDVTEPRETWCSRIAQWWQAPATALDVLSARVAALSADALQHKLVLQDAITAASPREDGLELAAYDWIGGWEKQQFDAVLVDREARLAESAAQLLQVQAQLTDSESERERLRQLADRLPGLEQQLAEARVDLAQTAERQAAAQAHSLELEQELAAARELIAGLQADLALADRFRGELEQRLQGSLSAQARWEASSKVLGERVAAGRAQLDALEADHDRLLADHERALGEREAFRQALAAVHASWSWRLTRPLRFLARWLRDLGPTRSPGS